mgnify:CR=1 FL=1
MRVSVVTLSFNQGRFLEQALTSVIQQRDSDLEYIVVDPGSTDGSREIIARYRRFIDHVVLEKDGGPADGLNKGFRLATGEIFGFVNADDYLLPGALATVAGSFASNPRIDVLSGHAIVVDELGNEINRFYSRRFTPRRYAYGAGTLAQVATFFRAPAFRRAGGFNANNRRTWDGELWLDMGLQGSTFGRVNQYLGAFRIHPNGISGSMRYAAEYERYGEEYFAKVMKRRWSRIDPLIHLLYKGGEYLSDPRMAAHRLSYGPVIRSRGKR